MNQIERLAAIFRASQNTAFSRIGSRGGVSKDLIQITAGVPSPTKGLRGQVQSEIDRVAVHVGNIAAVPRTYIESGNLLGTEYLLRLLTH